MAMIYIVPPVVSALDAATQAWVAAVQGAGGTVSGTQQSRVNTLIVGLKADSLWTIISRIWLYSGESVAQQAKIDIKALASHTLIGTPTLAAAGYTGDSGVGTSTNYINTNFDISADANYTNGDASTLAYIMNSRTVDQFWFSFGVKGAGGQEIIMNSFRTAPLSNFSINNNIDGATTTTNAQGLWIMSRVTAVANEAKTYRNGNTTPILTDSASQTFDRTNFSGVPIYACARNDNNASPGSVFGSGDQVGALAFGAGLSAAQQANFASRINNYMTAWGVNVF